MVNQISLPLKVSFKATSQDIEVSTVHRLCVSSDRKREKESIG